MLNSECDAFANWPGAVSKAKARPGSRVEGGRGGHTRAPECGREGETSGRAVSLRPGVAAGGQRRGVRGGRKSGGGHLCGPEVVPRGEFFPRSRRFLEAGGWARPWAAMALDRPPCRDPGEPAAAPRPYFFPPAPAGPHGLGGGGGSIAPAAFGEHRPLRHLFSAQVFPGWDIFSAAAPGGQDPRLGRGVLTGAAAASSEGRGVVESLGPWPPGPAGEPHASFREIRESFFDQWLRRRAMRGAGKAAISVGTVGALFL